MKTEKLSLKGIKNVLSRGELKRIMAGSGNCSGLNGACGVGTQAVCCSGLTCRTTVFGQGSCQG
ncbi:MAG: hypothetical protein JWQ63_2283 [Mucilaginibacter sp.]|nr:hypothetical protein [Mucilaginibacter sp.]